MIINLNIAEKIVSAVKSNNVYLNLYDVYDNCNSVDFDEAFHKVLSGLKGGLYRKAKAAYEDIQRNEEAIAALF